MEVKRDSFKNIPEDVSINAARLEEALDYISINGQDLKTCFVNPDLTADHVMISDELPSIFDFENTNLFGLRFSDFVNQFTKLWFFGDKEEALEFSKSFWRYNSSDRSEYIGDLKILLYMRCVGFTWELLTEPSDYHNTTATLNQEFAGRITEVLDYTLNL